MVKQVWQSEEGATFDTEEEAREHEAHAAKRNALLDLRAEYKHSSTVNWLLHDWEKIKAIMEPKPAGDVTQLQSVHPNTFASYLRNANFPLASAEDLVAKFLNPAIWTDLCLMRAAAELWFLREATASPAPIALPGPEHPLDDPEVAQSAPEVEDPASDAAEIDAGQALPVRAVPIWERAQAKRIDALFFEVGSGDE